MEVERDDQGDFAVARISKDYQDLAVG